MWLLSEILAAVPDAEPLVPVSGCSFLFSRVAHEFTEQGWSKADGHFKKEDLNPASPTLKQYEY